jgi:hypothetical protein
MDSHAFGDRPACRCSLWLLNVLFRIVLSVWDGGGGGGVVVLVQGVKMELQVLVHVSFNRLLFGCIETHVVFLQCIQVSGLSL